MSIRIGDNNKIKKSKIIDNSNSSIENKTKHNFANCHPLLTGIFCSIIASLIMMFSFWDKISEFMKSIF